MQNIALVYLISHINNIYLIILCLKNKKEENIINKYLIFNAEKNQNICIKRCIKKSDKLKRENKKYFITLF